MTTITEQLGRVLADRYRLDAGLGSGTSAHVYAAYDTRLGRRVAIKLVHPGLVDDEGFLRRLRAEAQSIAALNHPNLLKVYDWGEEGGVPFLVLEFLGGGSLRSILDTGCRLSPTQAATVGLQAARGLAYAHRRGFVHRDIKPANLLFDDEGVLRIGDFGLARALAEAAWTEPAGATLGTARYASPEQAQGYPLDDRSDVYSLALVLYESVVGRVPFSADTTLATLMARVGAQLPVVGELGPLGPILALAAIADPIARLDAAEFADQLELLVRQLPAPAPLPAGATSRPQLGPPVEQAPRRSPAVPAAAEFVTGVVTTVAGDRTPRDGASPAADGAPQGSPRPRRRRAKRRNRLRAVLVTGLVLALLAAGGTVAALRFVVDGHVVPAVLGDTLAAARSAASRSGLRLAVTGSRYSETTPAGSILGASPRAGLHVRSGTRLAVVVSKGHAPVLVPVVAGKTRATATAAVADAHLVARVSYAYSETVAAGTVLSERPDYGTAAYGSSVALLVSRGPSPRTIPGGLVGASWPTVQQKLSGLRLTPVRELAYSTSVASGSVISLSPAEGTAGIAVGTQVTVVVSKGPRLVAVPPVQGDSISSALAALQAAGLDVTEQIGPPNATYATTTVPAAGAQVPPGTQITLYAG